MGTRHVPKVGALLTGAEWEDTDHIVPMLVPSSGDPVALRYALLGLFFENAASTGTYKIRVGADTTGLIAWDATATDILADLGGLAGVGLGNVRLEPGSDPDAPLPARIQFIGALAGAMGFDIEIVDDTTDGVVAIDDSEEGDGDGTDADPADPVKGDHARGTDAVWHFDGIPTDAYPNGQWIEALAAIPSPITFPASVAARVVRIGPTGFEVFAASDLSTPLFFFRSEFGGIRGSDMDTNLEGRSSFETQVVSGTGDDDYVAFFDAEGVTRATRPVLDPTTATAQDLTNVLIALGLVVEA